MWGIGCIGLCLREVGEPCIIPVRAALERVAAQKPVAQKALDEITCCQRCGYATMETQFQAQGWQYRLTGHHNRQYIYTDVQVSGCLE